MFNRNDTGVRRRRRAGARLMAKKILLIEYEPRYLDRIRGHLAGKDFDLVVAKDGEEGLEAYRKSRPDLVLISSVLPKLRTPDVIKGMQGLGAPPPILLMMSGYKGKNKKSDAERVGATSILEKPFSEDVFLSEISSALGSGASAPSDGGAPLLSADDIFSDVLSGMDDEPRPAAAPGGTDPGIQKKLEQTLSGILPSPKRSSTPSGITPREAPAKPEKIPTGSQTLRVDAFTASPPGAPKSSAASRVESSVDKMLTDTLSGLKNAKALADKGAPAARPAPDLGLDALEKLGTSDRLRAARPPSPASDKTERLDMRSESLPRPAPVPATPPPPAPVEAPSPRAAEAKSSPVPPPAKKEERRREPSQQGAPASTGGFGRYQLLEKIAAGGMAEVFKARMRGEEGFEKIVAIKRILPHMADNDDFITMFVDEAKLAAQLTHNNIIHIYDLGKVEQYHYIAMEYVEGKDLRSILKLGGEREFPLPPELALFVASKIANALDYAHRRLGIDGKELNLVHRDVSPQNILISFEGDIKLCDFGIAKAATKVSQTQTGALKGKLQYMSPEQAWGKKIDRRTDIFSLGIVLFEMLTGERLFTGDTDLTILEQVRDARVVAPSTRNPDVPKKVDQIVLKALAKNPQDRYQNASELEKDINQVLYSYQPTPGPADLAIYMHRLLDASPAASDAQIDAAFAKAEQAPVAEPQKKGKGLVIAKKAAVPERTPEPPAPAPVEVSQPAISMGKEPAKSRTGLYAGIGVAAVVLIAAGVFVTRKKPEPAPAPGPAPEPPAASSSAAAPAPAAPTQAAASAPPSKIIDQKAVDAEVRRLAALKEKELAAAAKPAAAPKQQAAPAAPAPAPAAVSLAPKQPLQPPKASEPAAASASTQVQAQAPAPAPPTRVVVAERPTEPPPPPPKQEPVRVAEARPVEARPADVPPASAAIREGDLVGPGEGVVEPRIVRLGSFANLPPQVKQMARSGSGSSQVTISALITETGGVADTRVIKRSPYPAVDDAAINALKSSKVEPATKNGVRVKMWKTFAITVRP